MQQGAPAPRTPRSYAVSGSSGGYGGRGKPQRRPWAPVTILLVVFGVVLVSQLAVWGFLGAEAAQAPSVTQNCQINIWIFHTACSEVSTANPNSYEAQQLAQSLEIPFLLIDAVFIVAVVWAVVSGRGAGGGRQIGNRRRR
jgi:hypothetical protein